MAKPQVRNIPDEPYERLRKSAREGNQTISATVLAAIERRLAWSDWESRLAQHPTTDLGVDTVTLLAEERAPRESETN